jgi:uncharacterized protein (TIGR02118 family)
VEAFTLAATPAGAYRKPHRVAAMPKMRLTVAYLPPADMDAFLGHYQGKHIPLIKAVPGLERLEWSKVMGTPTGEPSRYAMIAELTFGSMEEFGAAMTSEASQAANADLANFAQGGVDIFICEVQD